MSGLIHAMLLISLEVLPLSGAAPLTSFNEVLEIGFVVIGAALAILVITIDPIFPKRKKDKKSQGSAG